MPVSKEVEKAIGQYLEKAALQLGGLSPDEKDAVLSDMESHIYSALEKAGPEPTPGDLNLVLARMDPPSAWAESQRAERGPAPRMPLAPPTAGAASNAERRPLAPSLHVRMEPRLSALAVATGVLTPIALLLIGVPIAPALSVQRAMYYPAMQRHMGLAYAAPSPTWAMLMVSIPGLALAVLSTALGLVAVSRIRASRGRLYGLPIAVATSVFFPILAMDIFFVAVAAVASHSILSIFPGTAYELRVATTAITAAATILLVLFFSVWAFRTAWRWASRALAAGELT